jgi:predicted AAA+ superfamily ATPase
LSYLLNAFFIFKAARSEIKGKKIFEINDKYYFEDIGLRHSVIGYKQPDINKIMENLVFMHMLSQGYQVFVGKLGNREIDFVCEKQGEKIYIQVAYIVSDQNREREFGNLLIIRDNYPKFVVSMDEFISNNEYEGIKQVNLRKFLSQNPDNG